MKETRERGEEISLSHPLHFFLCLLFGTDLGNEHTLSSWEKHQTQVSYLQILS